MTKAELPEVNKQRKVISHKLIAGKLLVHIFAEEDPGDSFVAAAPDLEDVFFTRIAAANEEAEQAAAPVAAK